MTTFDLQAGLAVQHCRGGGSEHLRRLCTWGRSEMNVLFGFLSISLSLLGHLESFCTGFVGFLEDDF